MGDPNNWGNGKRWGPNIRRALLMRRIRKTQAEPPGGLVHADLRARRAIRILLQHGDEEWPLPKLALVTLLTGIELQELADALGTAGLAEVYWSNSRRCIRLSPLGQQAVPDALALYRSQSLAAILLREGPRSAVLTVRARRRQRAHKQVIESDATIKDEPGLPW
jgi:hypothetical protein